MEYKEIGKKYKPQKWLFPGQKKDKHITTRTVQKIFEKVCRKTGINKEATVHSLKRGFYHIFALKGVNLKYIQELLGYKSNKTTEIYSLQ
ncbi:hypothetical protein DRP05_04980 [Archaeoglobales archaeon]|nr:MAG: hypothetical protein DRP05_04980 [Archaeoglobales archaeon]